MCAAHIDLSMVLIELVARSATPPVFHVEADTFPGDVMRFHTNEDLGEVTWAAGGQLIATGSAEPAPYGGYDIVFFANAPVLPLHLNTHTDHTFVIPRATSWPRIWAQCSESPSAAPQCSVKLALRDGTFNCLQVRNGLLALSHAPGATEAAIDAFMRRPDRFDDLRLCARSERM